MDIRATRRKNFDSLVEEAGSIAALARTTNANEKYLRQIANGFTGNDRKSPRQVGDALARTLEKGMKKPSGWMDTPHDDALPPQEAAFAERVQSELLAHEVPKHIQDAILTLLASSPPRKS